MVAMKKLIKSIENPNLAKGLDDKTLLELGRLVGEAHEENQESMKHWHDVLKSGIELSRPDDKAKSVPWDGASNYKSQIANDAIRDFGDKAVMEILGNPDLIAADYEGDKTPEVDGVCERITKHMNYQVNQEMGSWRYEQKSLFYRLAAQGNVFKKTWFDSAEGKNVSESVGYPDFSINNKCSSIKDNHRFTHIKCYTPNEIFERQAQGLWLDLELTHDQDEKQSSGHDHYRFLEQFTNYDLDGDGYAEPLLVTVHGASDSVVRITPLYDRDTIKVKYNGVVNSLAEFEDRILNQEAMPLFSEEEHVSMIQEQLKELHSKAKLVCIEMVDMLTCYGFINAADGTLLSYGFLHVMTSALKGINKSANSLFNAGDAANMQGGFLSSEHRDKRKGNLKFTPAMWKQTNISSTNLANSVLPLPIKEPSQTLLAMNEGLKTELRDMGTKTNINDMLSPNIAAVSVLGMLQEGVIPTSALMHSLLEAMSAEFKVMYELNKRYTDPVLYSRLNPQSDYEMDYNEDLFIKPTANAKFSSQMQRVQLAQVEMEQLPIVLQAGGNPMPIVKGFFDAIGSEKSDVVFSQKMSPQEQQMQQQMLAMQQAQMEAQQKQAEVLEAEYNLRAMEAQQKAEESNAKIAQMIADTERKDREQEAKEIELAAQIENLQAKTIETLQNAEKLDAETLATQASQVMEMFERAKEEGIKKISITKVE